VGRDVFISYAREDRPKVQKLANALESKGLRVWWDPEIKAGMGFRTEIAQALAESRAVVVVWSRFSVSSRFVCDEADEGAARDVLYPALIDSVDIPLGFRQIQTADLTHWKGRTNDPALVAFVDTVNKGARGKLGTPPRPAPVPQRQPEPEEEVSPQQKPKKVKETKPKAKREPKAEHEPKPEKAARFTTTGAKQRAGLFYRSVFLTALAATLFAAIAYGSQFVFESYRPAFVAAVAALAFLSRYGTFQADRAFGAASTHLMSRSYVALIAFSLILLAPLIMEGRMYAAALQGVQVRGIEGADINGVSLDLSGKRLLTSSDDGTVRVWDAETGVQRGEYRGHAGTGEAGDNSEDHWVWNAAFSPDAALAVSASRDLTAQIWKTGIVAPVRTLEGHTRSVKDAAWQPQNEAIATASNDATIRIWNPETGETIRTLTGHSGAVNAIDFSLDGNLLASASDDGTIRIWDWRSGRRINSTGAGGSAQDVRFSKDGAMVVAAAEGGRVRVWRTQSLARVRDFDHGARAFSAVFLDGDKSVASSGVDGIVRIFALEGDAEPRELLGHKDAVRSLDSNADGSLLISGSRDNTARVWEAASGRERRTMGHIAPAIRLPVALDQPPYFTASRAPVPMDFRAQPNAAAELLGKGLFIAAVLAIAALFLKGVLWVLRLRPLARMSLIVALGATALYVAALIASALPIEALWLWLTLAFVPAAILAVGRWLVLGSLLGSGRRKSGGQRTAKASSH